MCSWLYLFNFDWLPCTIKRSTLISFNVILGGNTKQSTCWLSKLSLITLALLLCGG
jgi:hypothetical protein